MYYKNFNSLEVYLYIKIFKKIGNLKRMFYQACPYDWLSKYTLLHGNRLLLDGLNTTLTLAFGM